MVLLVPACPEGLLACTRIVSATLALARHTQLVSTALLLRLLLHMIVDGDDGWCDQSTAQHRSTTGHASHR
jgi:hypothetical protein